MIKIKTPNSLIGKNFRIIHIHSNNEVSYIISGEELSIGTYAIEGDYIVTYINNFSDFAFAVTESSFPIGTLIGLIVVGSVSIILASGLAFYFYKKRKTKEN